MDAHLPLQSHRFVMAVLPRLIPTFLLGHLVTSLMGHVLALGVGDRGANFVRRCPAFGVGHLFAVLHWQLFALLPRHLLAHLVAGALLERNMFANFLSFVVPPVVMVLDMLDMDLFLLFLQSDLLRAKAYGKTSAKSKFLANVPTNHCTSEPSKKVKRTFLPNATICLDNFNNLSTFRLFNSLFLATHIFSTIVCYLSILIHVLNFGTLIPDRPLPLLVLRLGLMVMHLDLHMVALFLLLHPAFRLVPALLLVLCMACLFIFSPTDFRIFCRALLCGLSVASFTWFIPALLRVFSLAFFIVLVVTLLIVLSVTLLMICRLAQLFILSLALRVVFRVAGGAVFSLALVLVLLHTHLFVMRFTMRRGDILPLNVTVRFLQLLLKVIPDLSKEPSAGGYH